jgi:hypothetical protein
MVQKHGGGFAGGYAADEVEHFAHGGRFGDHLTLLRRDFLGDVLDGGHYAIHRSRVGINGSRADHCQSFAAAVGVQANRVERRAGGLVQSLDHPAFVFAGSAAEDVSTVPAHHLLGTHAKEFFGGRVDTGDFEIFVVEQHGIGELFEHRFQRACTLPGR